MGEEVCQRGEDRGSGLRGNEGGEGEPGGVQGESGGVEGGSLLAGKLLRGDGGCGGGT